MLDVLFIDTLDFRIDTPVAMRCFATSPTMAAALKAVCQEIGLELIEYDTGNMAKYPGEEQTRVTLRSRLWREKLQRGQSHVGRR